MDYHRDMEIYQPYVEDMPDADTCADRGHEYCEHCERHTLANAPYQRYDKCGRCDTPYEY